MLPLTKHITANWKTHTADDTNEVSPGSVSKLSPLHRSASHNYIRYIGQCADIVKYIVRRNTLRQAFYSHFNRYNIDVLLLPAGPAPAQPLGTTKYWSYTSMFNLLDWPAAVLPTGLAVDAKLDAEEFSAPRNEQERHLFETCEWSGLRVILDPGPDSDIVLGPIGSRRLVAFADIQTRQKSLQAR